MERVENLELQVQELLKLLEAAKQLNSNLEIEEVFQNILLQMVTMVGAEAGTLWVLDQDGEEIKVVAAYGESADKIVNIRLKKDEGIAGKVIMSGEPVLIRNVQEHPDWSNRVDESSGFVTKSMITVPLTVKGKVLGSLQLLNKKQCEFFNEADVSLAVALASQSAMALHNSQMYDELQQMFLSMIRTLAKVLDARDPYTAGHSERVANYSVWIAGKLGMAADKKKELYKAALLHDVGKIGIPDDILRKPDRLTTEEYEAIKLHTVVGADILSNMEPKRAMADVIQTARSHHERIDGSGYPDGLKGNEISLFARIVGVADTFDAMTTARSYSKGMPYSDAAEELIRCKDTLFDSAIVDAFTTVLAESEYDLAKYEADHKKEYRL
ncbi:GAF and HD-GYP domain-containing protein [Planomicrobium okeanokoites]|uniref:HD domain-containing phosphohydrolase n=1 Tax=Planomicrobium okeanokoites TaxID=244 RepID=A0ABV7KIT8_PLAOK|nr:HD domain-containing phosphohydrolase [Planomicrobium okeanokoites]TAA69081.1 HD domain-containing protein [Planomicrobium okeanokoites]